MKEATHRRHPVGCEQGIVARSHPSLVTHPLSKGRHPLSCDKAHPKGWVATSLQGIATHPLTRDDIPCQGMGGYEGIATHPLTRHPSLVLRVYVFPCSHTQDKGWVARDGWLRSHPSLDKTRDGCLSSLDKTSIP